MIGSPTARAEGGLALLRRLSGALAEASTDDDVARAAFSTASGLPGVRQAGMALNSVGGRELAFVASGGNALGHSPMRWCLIDAFADLPLVDAVRRGADVYAGSLDDIVARYPGYGSRQGQTGTRALAALALRTDTEPVGALLLLFDREQEFDDEQRWLLGAFGSQLTQALQRNRAARALQSTAEQLQRSLLPHSLPDLPGLLLGSHYRPGGLGADVGGDWYDVVALADGSAAVVVGDVMGKGVAAAVAMGELRAALRAYVLLDPTPSAVLDRMDAFVASQGAAEQLVTMAYGVVAADRRTFTLGLAGHPPPLVVSPGEKVEALARHPGPALGLGAGPWPEETVDLTPGRTLLFYSDGLVESRARDFIDGVVELARHVEDIPDRRRQPRELCDRVAHLMTDDHTDDDVTLLAVGVPRTGVRRALTQLPGKTIAPREARHFLRDILTAWRVEQDVLDTAELCVSELVTNAVIHTRTATELVALLDADYLTVLVRDGGGPDGLPPAASRDDALAISGRGLGLVDAVVTAWAAEHGASGRTVWFEIERPVDQRVVSAG